MACVELDLPERIVAAYAAACDAVPNNEELLSHLFMAYVRTRQFAQQQQTAKRLFEANPDPKYSAWMAASAALRADDEERNGDGSVARKLLWPVCEGLVRKLRTGQNAAPSSDVYALYAEALRRQDKWAQLAADLDSPAVRALYVVPSECDATAAAALLRAQNWHAAADAYGRLLSSSSGDEWQLWCGVLDAFEGQWRQAAAEEGRLAARSSVERIIVRHIEQQDTVPTARQLRGPLLARLELQRRLAAMCVPTAAQESERHLLDYFRRFGDRRCAFSDMRPYLGLIVGPANDFVAQLLSSGAPTDGLSPDTAHLTVDGLQRYICAMCCARWLGAHDELTAEAKRALAATLWRVYVAAMPLSATLKPSEAAHGDGIVAVAAQILLDAIAAGSDTSATWVALGMLQHAWQRSKANFHLTLPRVWLYCRLGAWAPAKQCFDILDVKHIQWDSLGYLIADHAAALAHFSDASSLLQEMLEFFHRGRIDVRGGSHVGRLARVWGWGGWSVGAAGECADARHRASNICCVSTQRRHTQNC